MIWSDEEEENEKKSEEEDKEVKKENEKEKEEDEKKSDEDEESESDSRTIRTPKEKIIELIKDKYNSIKTNIKNQVYKKVLDNFDELQKNNDKINSIFKREEIPAYYYECFALIDDLLNMSKDDQKKLSKENNASFNSIKKVNQRITKKIGVTLAEYKKNRKTEKELNEDLEKIMKKSAKKGEESSDDDDIDIIQLMKRDEDKEPAQRRLKWVKKEKVEKPKKEATEKEKDTKKPKDQTKKITEANVKTEKIEEALSDADIEKESEQFSKQRGQNKSPIDAVPRLEFLYSKASSQFIKIKILTLINLFCFDSYSNPLSAFPYSLWEKVYENIETLIELHDNLKKENEKQSEVNEKQNKEIDNMSLILQNNLSTMMEKLEIELYKSLQFNINNANDFITSMQNELKFLKLCKKAETFYSNLKNLNIKAKIYLLVIMHTYYKSAGSIKTLIKKNNIKFEDDDYIKKIVLDDDKNYFKSLCNNAYTILDEENKIKVMLYQIYFLCIRNDYESATKLFNSSNLFELVSVYKSESLKILFNRTLAQLSLCAFKNLDLEEVLRYLTPLCSKGPTKLKEYLSQSYTKDSEKNALFDREDKKRAIPYIMKINTDDLDTIFYLSSMIYDVPKILLEKIFGSDTNNDYNYNSHVFERIFYNFQRQQFNGPSHVDKDKILATTTILMKGDWKRCIQEVKKLNLIKKYSYLQEKLFELIKRTALKCYIIFYMTEYQSFELNKLSKRFEIDANEVKNIINDMILRRQLKAKWNDNYLLMKSNDRDSIVNMKKLIDNVQIITKQNLELMQAALALANSE